MSRMCMLPNRIGHFPPQTTGLPKADETEVIFEVMAFDPIAILLPYFT